MNLFFHWFEMQPSSYIKFAMYMQGCFWICYTDLPTQVPEPGCLLSWIYTAFYSLVQLVLPLATIIPDHKFPGSSRIFTFPQKLQNQFIQLCNKNSYCSFNLARHALNLSIQGKCHLYNIESQPEKDLSFHLFKLVYLHQ